MIKGDKECVVLYLRFLFFYINGITDESGCSEYDSDCIKYRIKKKKKKLVL